MPVNLIVIIIERRINIVLAFAVALIAFIVYANSLGNGFVWDDDLVIVANPTLKGDCMEFPSTNADSVLSWKDGVWAVWCIVRYNLWH